MDPKPQPHREIYLRALRRLTPEQGLLKAFELTELSRGHDIGPADPARVSRALSGPGAYPDAAAVADASRRRSVFTLIEEASSDEADFWLLRDAPFDGSRFAWRIAVEALGMRRPASRSWGLIF